LTASREPHGNKTETAVENPYRNRYGKSIPETPNRRGGKPVLLGRYGNPYYFLYLGVGAQLERLSAFPVEPPAQRCADGRGSVCCNFPNVLSCITSKWGIAMGAAKVLVAAAIGGFAGVMIGYISFDASGYMISVSFTDWLTHEYYVGGKQDAILWGIGGAGIAAGLSLLLEV